MNDWTRRGAWLAGHWLLLLALPACGQVVLELREIDADGAVVDSIKPPPELAIGPGFDWRWTGTNPAAGTTRARFDVDENGGIASSIRFDDEATRVVSLRQGYRLYEAIQAWTFSPGEPRRLEAIIELARPGAPTASESGSTEALRRWLRRLESWTVPKLLESCDPCRIWTAVERESRAVAASLDDPADLFGPITRSAHPTLAAIAGWRVAEAEGRSLDEVLGDMTTSRAPCARYVAGRRFLEQAPHLVRGASVSDLDELTAALKLAGVRLAAMRPTSTLPNLAMSSTGNGSDHILGMAYFERIDADWRLLCRGTDHLDL